MTVKLDRRLGRFRVFGFRRVQENCDRSGDNDGQADPEHGRYQTPSSFFGQRDARVDYGRESEDERHHVVGLASCIECQDHTQSAYRAG